MTDSRSIKERIKKEAGRPVFDARVSIRLTEEQMEALKKLADKNGIAYTRLAAIFVEQGLEEMTNGR